MRIAFKVILLFLLPGLSWSQATSVAGVFVENLGQWAEPVEYKLELNSGAIFFERNGYTILLQQPREHNHSHGFGPYTHKHESQVKAHALKVKFLGSSSSEIYGNSPLPYYNNYLTGNDESKWRSHVRSYQTLDYQNIAEGVNVKFYSKENAVKYDIIVSPYSNPDDIEMEYKGAQRLYTKNGKLFIETSIGTVVESVPETYQMINGYRKKVRCKYVINKATVSFDVGRYDKSYPLIIDPVLEFSSLSGSSANNFGFTATYDDQGNLYGGGIAFAAGYPTTAGALEENYQGKVDVSISKFSPQGDSLIYSTYLGGNEDDLPSSMVVNSKGELVILGLTGSANFPVSGAAYQDTFFGGPPISNGRIAINFTNGCDIFVSVISQDGGSLVGSTFFGGTKNDGVNIELDLNYGDLIRGEVNIDGSDNIYIASSTKSLNIPLVGNSHNVDRQTVVLASFNPTASQLNWASYLGGQENEAGYSLKYFNNELFVTGCTSSNDFANISRGGTPRADFDGFLAKLNASTGALIGSIYLGTTDRDQSYFVDIDKLGNAYVLGQSNGSMPVLSTIGTGPIYSIMGSYQFIQKWSNDLSTLVWSTQFGSGQGKYDLIPTAFLVDQCFNIYLSGWNGVSNSSSLISGNTIGLPTVDSIAYQTTTDGSDFYFAVLSRDAKDITYGSFFGDSQTNEHVDGGTSRFSPQGIVYQAVCAACQTGIFPTTPGAFSQVSNSTGCNLGVIKIDFQQNVQAVSSINFNANVDTVCDRLDVTIDNNSINADIFYWDFGNGDTSSLEEPTVSYADTGTYTITLVATDTVCDISDTTQITIVHDQGEFPEADFNVNYQPCDGEFEAHFVDNSKKAKTYLWDFGNGITSTNKNPVHNFPAEGIYDITLTVFDTTCGRQASVTKTIEFNDTIPDPSATIEYSECSDGTLNVILENFRPWYLYEWKGEQNVISTEPIPQIRVSQPGKYTYTMTIADTSCNKSYSQTIEVDIETLKAPIWIPKAFTPNNDFINEEFKIAGSSCDLDDYFRIYNRWGQLVFQTNRPFNEFWDGTFNGKDAVNGGYSYVLKRGEDIKRGSFVIIR